MEITVTIDAQPGFLFAPDAFDGTVGKTLQLKGYVHTPTALHDIKTPAIITAVKVIDGGNRALITVRVDDAITTSEHECTCDYFDAVGTFIGKGTGRGKYRTHNPACPIHREQSIDSCICDDAALPQWLRLTKCPAHPDVKR